VRGKHSVPTWFAEVTGCGASIPCPLGLQRSQGAGQAFRAHLVCRGHRGRAEHCVPTWFAQSTGGTPHPCGAPRTPRGTMSTRSQASTPLPTSAPRVRHAMDSPTALPARKNSRWGWGGGEVVGARGGTQTLTGFLDSTVRQGDLYLAAQVRAHTFIHGQAWTHMHALPPLPFPGQARQP